MLSLLLVEDEPASAEYLASIVGKYLPEIRIIGTAEDGLSALEILKAQPCNVIISDICMPRMDGLELAQTVNEKWPGISMVIVSGFERFEYAKKALKYGVKDYLLKPVMPTELIDCLNRLKGKNSAGAVTPRGSDGEGQNAHGVEDDFSMIKSYIENHLSEVLSLGKLSSALNMSQASLMRTLRNCADMTFVEYVTRERIERAKALIESQPHCRLKEIAAQVGFSDALYFSRVFRQYTGYPPSEYVKIIYTGK